jgi:tRNA G18 (ribose-2'-O)-methylase SpoU
MASWAVKERSMDVLDVMDKESVKIVGKKRRGKEVKNDESKGKEVLLLGGEER